jgi:hypothetical protein
MCARSHPGAFGAVLAGSSRQQRQPHSGGGMEAQGPLTAGDLAQFRREGYVVARGLLPRSTIEAVQAEISEAVDEFAEELLSAGEIQDTHTVGWASCTAFPRCGSSAPGSRAWSLGRWGSRSRQRGAPMLGRASSPC